MLFVISAPSGAGKTTIIRELFRALPDLSFSVSATTRKKRESETEDKDYHFLTVEEFNRKKDNDEFIETEDVHGNLYGTLKSEIEPFLQSGDHLIFDVDVKGALSIRKFYPAAVLIFIDVPAEELIRRLKGRKTELDEEIDRRTSRIMMEVEEKTKFDHIVDNSKGVSEAVNEVKRIILSHSK
jgi:guanylate kinase